MFSVSAPLGWNTRLISLGRRSPPLPDDLPHAVFNRPGIRNGDRLLVNHLQLDSLAVAAPVTLAGISVRRRTDRCEREQSENRITFHVLSCRGRSDSSTITTDNDPYKFGSYGLPYESSVLF